MIKGGLGNLMKQAQQVQANLQKVQAELLNMEITGQAGGNMVVVVMTGKHDIKRVTIDPALLKDDKEMLEDLIAAAVNDAVRQVEKMTQDKYQAVTGGMGLPGGMKLPFSF